MTLLEQIAEGRTDLVFEYLAGRHIGIGAVCQQYLHHQVARQAFRGTQCRVQRSFPAVRQRMICKESVETGGFMRDVRTKGETPLHRAAAFGDEESIQMLLDAGAKIDAKDMHGDSPLSWASWHLRPVSILRKLCYGDFRIHPEYTGMEANLQGRPEI